MPFDLTLAFVLTVLFAAAVARSALGFGDALVAMPLLALAMDLRAATPLVALASAVAALAILPWAWRKLDLRAAARLLAATLLGIPFGLFLLTRAPEGLVKGILGALLIAFGLYNLIGPRLPELKSDRFALPFGFVAGVLGGAYNTNGPPVVAYGVMRRWSPEAFRATLNGYFLASNLAVLIAHAAAGLWTPTVFRAFLFGIPVVLVGLWIGWRLHRRANPARFHQAVNLFLTATGLLLLLR